MFSDFDCPVDNSTESMDPSRYLSNAHPIISTQAGTAYALAPTESTPDEDGFERRFGFFNAGVAPGTNFKFRLDLAGNKVGNNAGIGSTVKDPASSVAIVLKTSTIYYDSRTVRVAFQVHDAVGRTRVLTSGLTLTMTMEVPSAESSQTANCDSPGATDGIGLCTLTAASSHFSTTADVAASVSVEVKYSGSSVAVSNTAVMTLVQEPTFDALVGASMSAALPHYPHMAGDVITVDVVANTDGQALDVWT